MSRGHKHVSKLMNFFGLKTPKTNRKRFQRVQSIKIHICSYYLCPRVYFLLVPLLDKFIRFRNASDYMCPSIMQCNGDFLHSLNPIILFSKKVFQMYVSASTALSLYLCWMDWEIVKVWNKTEKFGYCSIVGVGHFCQMLDARGWDPSLLQLPLYFVGAILIRMCLCVPNVDWQGPVNWKHLNRSTSISFTFCIL